MPVFQYVARDMAGQQVTETLAFNSESALREYLRKNNLYVVQVLERRRSPALFLRRRVGLEDIIVTTRQLRTMLNAGMPLVSGLDILAEQSTNPALADVLRQVGRSVAHGSPFAETLAEYPHVFPPMLVALASAGEEAGRLAESLQEAGRQLELQMDIRQKLISALTYPAFTVVATLGVVIFMLLWIVPVFRTIYDDLHAPLPAVTQSVVATSQILIHQGWVVVVCLITLAVTLRRYAQLPEGRVRIDGWMLSMPLLGQLFRKTASANLTGSLAGLVESGVPLIQALQTAAETCGNEVIAGAVRGAARNVLLGRRLSDELEASGEFPLVVTRMIAISEEVGTLSSVLREIAASYNTEVEYAVRRIVGLLEPVMILCVGGVVGYLLLALYYPIFNLSNVFLKGA